MIIGPVCEAQNVLRGRLTDRETGEPLFGANVLVKGTFDGAVTEPDGTFELETTAGLPLVLVVSYTGYGTIEEEVGEWDQPLRIQLGEGVFVTDIVEVRGQRISEKQKAAPLTVESLDGLAIKQTPSDNFYDGLGALKGVDLTAASLGFKVINTRGFNSTSPVRSLQLIDGVDNQAPGLNFSLGNFLGSPELDVNRVDLIQGASSAFYGPNAFNGVISMETKNPFLHEGLSAMVKVGERNLMEGAVRWADVFFNRKGQALGAYKVNFSYLRANDWPAENDDPIFESRVPASNPGGYDAVNTYGDEYFPGHDFSGFNLLAFPGLGTFYRTGYREVDLVDYDTRNLKANAALHLRTAPGQGLNSPELIFASNFGTGTTVYQGDNRFSLRNILFFQNRIEWRKRDKFFLRAYATHEDAGDSYDPFLTALELQDQAKTNLRWGQDYSRYWQNEINPQILADEDFPQPVPCIDPITGLPTICFDQEAAQQWLDDHPEDLSRWHGEAEAIANRQSASVTQDYFEPGTERFDEAFNDLVTRKRTEGGTLFFDRSALYHIQGEYIFNPTWVDEWKVGASGRLYTPRSEGTVFSDTAGTTITNYEYGLYTGLSKRFAKNKLNAQATLRVDKNQNFDFLFSPAASLVYNPNNNTFLRLSFSSAIRNPTLTDQYLFLDVGPAILSGNLEGAENLVTLESLDDFLNFQDPGLLDYFDIAPVKPERVRTLEAGIRTTLFDKLYVDAGYYFNEYNDFLGFNLGAEISIDPGSGRLSEIQVYRYAANSTNVVTTQGFAIGLNYYFGNYFMAQGNYSWNQLIKTAEDDPIIPAFNTPEHKFNIGISGRDIPLRLGSRVYDGLGFNINYKWIEGFLFEGSPQFTGLVPTYDLLDAQVNYHIRRLNTTVKVGASNLLDNRQFQTYGGPRIGRLAYLSLTYEFSP